MIVNSVRTRWFYLIIRKADSGSKVYVAIRVMCVESWLDSYCRRQHRRRLALLEMEQKCFSVEDDWFIEYYN